MIALSNVEIENNNILTLDGIKEEKLNEDSLLEAIVKLKSTYQMNLIWLI